MKATLSKDGVLTIEIDTNDKPTVSTSRKSLIVASSHGNQATTVQVNGQPLIVSVNAYIKNDGYKAD